MESNREIISKLKFISRLQKTEKINSKLLYVQQDGIITQFLRTIFQDNRFKTLTFVQDTINKSFELITYYDKSPRTSERIMCSNIIDDLRKSKTGLSNLKETYFDDSKFCCDIDTLLQLIDAKLIEYHKYDLSTKTPNLLSSPLSLPKPILSTPPTNSTQPTIINIQPHTSSALYSSSPSSFIPPPPPPLPSSSTSSPLQEESNVNIS